jgi:endonuclease/exonuclease/phosphatase (EEP) superfamily protein YafD
VRAFFSALLVAASAGLAAIALLSLGGSFSDRLDVLTHFAPLALGASLGVLLVALPLARGRARAASVVLAGAALLATSYLVVPEFAAAARPLPPVRQDAERLRLLQFNVYFRNADPRATADYVMRVDPDVVFLQEANARGAIVADALRARYPHQVTCSGPEGACGTRVLAKRRPLSTGRLTPHGEDGSLGAAWMTLPLLNGGRATVLATHYTWPIPAGPQQAQSRALARMLHRFPRDTLIVGGDFNSTPWSFSLRRQDRAFGLERRTRALFSWPDSDGRPALLPIDHVYAGAAWRTVSVRRGPRTPSDHHPVLVELAHVAPANR